MPDEVAVGPGVELGKAARSNVPVLEGWAAAEPESKAREVSLRFWLRPVELGDTYGNMIAAQGGVAAGERVITTGVNLIKTGDRIRVIP